MIKAVKYVYNEHRLNIRRIFYMAKINVIKSTINTSIGLWWIFIKDLVYFSVFTGFRYLIAGSTDIEGMNFIIFVFTGLVPWFMANEVITGGSTAIIRNKSIINNIIFPLTIIPTIEVFSIFMKRITSLFFIIIIIAIFGTLKNINLLLVIYYMVAFIIIMIAYNLAISGLIALSNDFHQFITTTVRIIFYSLPILWSFERIGINNKIILLLKINPLTYIILGFRDAFVHNKAPDVEYSIYFWLVTIIGLLLGCKLQYKLRRYYSDFI